MDRARVFQGQTDQTRRRAVRTSRSRVDRFGHIKINLKNKKMRLIRVAFMDKSKIVGAWRRYGGQLNPKCYVGVHRRVAPRRAQLNPAIARRLLVMGILRQDKPKVLREVPEELEDDTEEDQRRVRIYQGNFFASVNENLMKARGQKSNKKQKFDCDEWEDIDPPSKLARKIMFKSHGKAENRVPEINFDDTDEFQEPESFTHKVRKIRRFGDRVGENHGRHEGFVRPAENFCDENDVNRKMQLKYLNQPKEMQVKTSQLSGGARKPGQRIFIDLPQAPKKMQE